MLHSRIPATIIGDAAHPISVSASMQSSISDINDLLNSCPSDMLIKEPRSSHPMSTGRASLGLFLYLRYIYN